MTIGEYSKIEISNSNVDNLNFEWLAAFNYSDITLDFKSITHLNIFAEEQFYLAPSSIFDASAIPGGITLEGLNQEFSSDNIVVGKLLFQKSFISKFST